MVYNGLVRTSGPIRCADYDRVVTTVNDANPPPGAPSRVASVTSADLPSPAVLSEPLDDPARLRAALLESEARFAAAFNASPHVMTISRLSDGRYLRVNDACHAVTGYSREEMIGRTSTELQIFPYPEGRNRLVHALRAGSVRNLEIDLRTKEGEIRTVLLSAEVITFDGVPCLLTNSNDITVQRRVTAERERLLARERTARLQAEARADRLRRLQDVTAACAEALTPLEVAQVVVNQCVAVLATPAAAVAAVTERGDAISNLHAVGYPEEMVKSWQSVPLTSAFVPAVAARTGEPIWLRSSLEVEAHYAAFGGARASTDAQAVAAVPLVVEGRTVGVLGMTWRESRDFDDEDRDFILAVARQAAQALERARLYERERRALAEATAAIQMRDHVLSTVSHDLRNPLTSIRGFSQLLLRRLAYLPDLPPDFASMLGTIDLNTQRMLTMLSELQDTARTQQGGGLALDRSATDLAVIVRDAVAAVAPVHAAHELTIDAESGDPLIGHWDRARLERAIDNLLANAIKYSPDGGPVVLSLAREQHGAAEWAVLRIRDHGIGIPAADLPHLFQPFHRAANAATIDGAGLGLAGVRGIVEQHGGRVAIDSAEGQGTTVTVRLPLTEPSPTA